MPIQSTYNPLAQDPYNAPPPPEQQQNLPGTDPMPAKPSPFGGKPGYQFNGGPISSGGAIAGIADNVLRGIVNGHAQAEQWKALKLKKKSDDLNASYQSDAQRLAQVSYAQYQATGKVDPSSPDYKAAKSAVDGSWGALQDFRTQLMEQQFGGGKKKGKQKPGEQPKPPQAVLSDPNSTPEEKLQAIMGVSQKLGPPVYSQISVLNTPAAWEHWQSQQQAAQVNELHGRNELTHEQALATYNKYAGMSKEQIAKLPPEQQTAFENSKQVLWPPEAQKVPVAGLMRYRKDAKGNTLEYRVDAEGNEIPDTERPLSTASTQGPKVGTFGDFMLAGYGDKPTPKQYVEGRKLWASSGAGTTTGEHVVMVPQQDGSIVPVTIMTTSTKSYGATPPPAARQDAASPEAPPSTSPAPSSATPTRRQRPPAAYTPSGAPPQRHGGAGVVGVGNAVGGKMTPAQSQAQTNYGKMVALVNQAQDAVQHAKTHPNDAAQSELDQALVFTIIHSTLQRNNQAEINSIMGAGGFSNQPDKWMDKLGSGTLPASTRDGLLAVTRSLARSAMKEGVAVGINLGGSSGSKMVNMKAPNGQVRPVPADQVDHYKSLGAVVVN